MEPSVLPSIPRIVAEIESLKTNLAKLEQIEGEGSDWEAVAEPLRDRMASLTRDLARAQAGSGTELERKATVLLDWLPESGDMPTLLAASLCRDIVLLFPFVDA